MTTAESVRFWIMYLITGAVFFGIFRGFIFMVLRHVRLIRAKLAHARETARAAHEVTKKILGLKKNGG